MRFEEALERGPHNHEAAIEVEDTHGVDKTILLQAGTHPKVVQERLGHASIAITLDTYSHVLPGLQEEAADAFAKVMGQAQNE